MIRRTLYLAGLVLCVYVVGYLHGCWRTQTLADDTLRDVVAERWWQRFQEAKERASEEAYRADSLAVELHNERLRAL